MKKKIPALLCCALLLCLVFLTVFSSCASAETLGFGMVNAPDVAIRTDAAGKKITRLPEGTCVWITDSKTDNTGELWYHVQAQNTAESGCPVYNGWMKAEFVDAGSRLWHDIQTVKASAYAMIVLKKDGTVWAFGERYGDVPVKLNIENVVAISGEDGNIAALKSDGTLWNCTIGQYDCTQEKIITR